LSAGAEHSQTFALAGVVLGSPRLHLRVTDSTNTRARELAAAGAPHGTLVTAAEQSAGRGRQGRSWSAPAGSALLCSLVIRDPPRLLPLAAGVAVAEVADAETAEGVATETAEVADAETAEGVATEIAQGVAAVAQLKWPNDVLIAGRKVAGILVEGRPQERWAVLGIGLNVALSEADFPAELRARAGTLGRQAAAIEPVLASLLASLQRWLAAPAPAVLEAVRYRDALHGHRVRWSDGEGRADGIDEGGRLVVQTTDGRRLALEAGEVHLIPQNAAF
jgi:BirA family transcriptional regulator, biotin operon repressor / biotin---[acetyl-CoA-carboxylase] ligase